MSEAESQREEFDLRISGDGISVERKIDSRTLAAVVAVVVGKKRFDEKESLSQHGAEVMTSVLQPRMTLRQYLDDVKASRKSDQIVAIGHFISHFEGQPDFSRDEVRSRFSIAREPMPKNFSRDFNLAVKDGVIAEVHQTPGRFYVTKAGISAIEKHFAKIQQK